MNSTPRGPLFERGREKFCPCCTTELNFSQAVERWACPDDSCDFVRWNSPQPVSAVVIAFHRDQIREGMIESFERLQFPLLPKDSAIVMVKRSRPPQQGKWCLPGGFVNTGEDARDAAVREPEEETGLIIKLEKELFNKNPEPGRTNQIVHLFLAWAIEGNLHAGDDAELVRVYTPEDMPEACFSTHKRALSRWFAGVYGPLLGKEMEMD